MTAKLPRGRPDRLAGRARVLAGAIARVRQDLPFTSDAWVMLPDHFHGVWTLRAGQSGFAPRWSAMRNAIGDYDPALYAKIPPAHEIWCHEIRCDADYRACIQYCWEDPVRHSLARAPDDWAYTSFAGQARATA